MRIQQLLLPALPLVLISGTSHAALSMTAVGEYDSSDNANTIDRYGNGNASSYASFKSAVAGAFAAGNGAVINFDSNLTGSQSGITTSYANGSKTLNISTNVPVNAQISGNITGISGTNSGTGGFLFASSATQILTLGFDSITGGAAGEYVSQIGFTLLSRKTAGGTPTITATVYFSDGTFADASANFTVIADGEDTFFSFTAPEGKAITSLDIDHGDTGDLRRGLDDLAFITAVPEPSAMLLGGLSLLPLMRRRR